MSFFFYSDKPEPRAGNIDVWKMNGTRAFLRHYDQYLFLNFVATNPLASEAEKRQARKELALCEKKLSFWKRHPNYDPELALRGIQELKRNWQTGKAA